MHLDEHLDKHTKVQIYPDTLATSAVSLQL